MPKVVDENCKGMCVDMKMKLLTRLKYQHWYISPILSITAQPFHQTFLVTSLIYVTYVMECAQLSEVP